MTLFSMFQKLASGYSLRKVMTHKQSGFHYREETACNDLYAYSSI